MLSHEITAIAGKYKARKRIGRGQGSGHGKTAGRGHKGQKSRAGYSRKHVYEGGQMPLSRRLPKRGFSNPFRKDIIAVNVARLNDFPQGSVVDAEALLARHIIKRKGDGIKVLGKGEISVPLTVRVQGVSKTAQEKIEASGGTVEVQ